jgi:hypothetical protein
MDRIFIIIGLAAIAVVVFVVSALVPDWIEASAVSYVADAAERAKTAAIMTSDPMRQATMEIERLEGELARADSDIQQARAVCADDTPGVIRAFFGAFF